MIVLRTYVRKYVRMYVIRLPQKYMGKGKNYRNIADKIEKKEHSIEDAVKFIKENKAAKFDESVEVHVRLNIDIKKTDQHIRGSVTLPHGTGKTKKVAVATSTKQDDAKKAGADIVGSEDLIEKIKKGEIEFDALIATPEMMPKLAPVAKILGPKGLMPNPKTDTVTEKVKEAVEMIKKGKLDFKSDKTGNVHQIIGKVSFDEKQLEENFNTLVDAISKSKPETVKGALIKSISMSSTMGPGIRVSI